MSAREKLRAPGAVVVMVEEALGYRVESSGRFLSLAPLFTKRARGGEKNLLLLQLVCYTFLIMAAVAAVAFFCRGGFGPSSGAAARFSSHAQLPNRKMKIFLNFKKK